MDKPRIITEEEANNKWTRMQAFTIFLCFILMALDGIDVLVVSFAAPLLIEQWNVTDAAFGMVFSAGLAGMTIGSMFLAPFADRIGRKPILMAATMVIAITMLAATLSQNLTQLIILRLLTGVGIGCVLATATSMGSEFSPKKYVAAGVMTVMSGYPAGAMLAGVVANDLLVNYGWESLFIVAGLLSLALFPIMYFLAPESVHFLLERRKEGDLERANKLLRAQGLKEHDDYPEREEVFAKTPAVPFMHLLKKEVRTTTLLSWVSFMGAFFTVYFLLSWIPRIASMTGYPLEVGIKGSALFNGGAVIGLFIVGWLTARWNLGKVIACLYGIATIMMVMFAEWNTPVIMYYTLLFGIGFFQQSGNGALYATVAQIYPTNIRTTGIGWAIGMGRLGAVLGPAAGGLALTSGMSVAWMFVLFSLPLLVTALCAWTIGVKYFIKPAKPAIKA
ncbi:MFS transporter [Alteromonas lipolytica]|uniref:Major facilitator superfamily (MFS) profile domain-containing protein n=1 Tax=Alteromonas lipolytica TaxID=1856405 RepID=A0A1E8FI54_9ALTE|nr:MFS transporter [Alteromonas lipolytica]OFI35627.1 hypothetical protein BFC17_12800 [Alteromonas lipolytica]GGF77710.1 MFS transporter [Alteromonas lipolytica]